MNLRPIIVKTSLPTLCLIFIGSLSLSLQASQNLDIENNHNTLQNTETAQDSPRLPVLTDYLSGVISLEKEKEIGQILIRHLRVSSQQVTDPLSLEYLRSLSYRLAVHSELNLRELEVLMIQDNSINAFAMPGGVIGVNSGLFLNADTEEEFSAVLAHEIAHLSQRHFARRLANHKNSQITSMAGLLASLLVFATAGAQPGIGAIIATQAAAQQEALSFSRRNEQEADRIGIQTLTNAGMSPLAMPAFFSKLQQASRYDGSRPPEYLLTHPVTESRIADTRGRARKLPAHPSNNSLEYGIIRMRLKVFSESNPKRLIAQLQNTLQKNKPSKKFNTVEDNNQQILEYGLALLHIKVHNFWQAKKSVKQLLKRQPSSISYALLNAEMSFEQRAFSSARIKLTEALSLHPDNFPLSVLLAKTLIRLKRADEAAYLLKTLTIDRPNTPEVWRLLVETYRLKQDRLNGFRAKAEYFYLYGLSDDAIKQLEYALPLAKGNYQLQSKIRDKINLIKHAQKEISL